MFGKRTQKLKQTVILSTLDKALKSGAVKEEQVAEFFVKMLERDPSAPLGAKDGTVRTNNGATAPSMKGVLAEVIRAHEHYGAYAGRHDGEKDVASRAAKDQATVEYTKRVNHYRAVIERFVGIDPKEDTLIYTLNTSDAIGKLALTCGYTSEDIVLVPRMEHTSNFLPWLLRSGASLVKIEQTREGDIDINDLEGKLEKYKGKVKLVAFTAASNITGIRPPIKKLADRIHRYGALAAVDCAQYAPHFPMDKKGWGADFVYFSAHKLGAPIGPGVLAAPIAWLEARIPAIPGGGTIEDLAADGTGDVPIWAPREAKHQPGTWPTIGIRALGRAAEIIMDEIGWSSLMQREQELLRYAYKKLSGIPGFEPLPIAPSRYENESLTPVISFNLAGYSPDELLEALAAARIQVRGGSKDPICNHDYVRNVLGLKGMVRLSFTHHNTTDDVDRVIEVLQTMRAAKPM